jgi:hypothetical protein
VSARRLLVGLVAAGTLASCGGGSGSPTAAPSPSPPASSSGLSPSNPCTAALAGLADVAAASGPRPRKDHGLGQDKRHVRDLLALHRLPHGGGVASRASAARAARSGEIALLADDGAILIPANPFDLAGVSLRFEPNPQGGYDARRADGGFRPDLGRRLDLGDDDATEQPLPFAFPFYGASRAAAFVNSDGNLTFGASDTASTERSLGRFLAGAPRVAPFFADLDPSAGGAVFASASAVALTVTWCAVPDFDGTGRVTAQASLLPGGAVEVRIDGSSTLKEAVVGVSPGSTDAFAPVDLSASGPSAGGARAVGERFAESVAVDLVTAARRFFAEFSDSYDQLVFWTDARATDANTFAFEVTVKNAIAGTGLEPQDSAASFGSRALESVVMMDDLGKYPEDPLARANGENTALALVAHETGHRWGATLRFRDASGRASDAWLGRQLAHWGFFTNSSASVLEGNEIVDLGGGSFRTAGTVSRYGPFDLYAMGLLAESDVPPTFFVERPSGTGQENDAPPRTGVSFTGTRRDVAIADVVAAMGPRNPPASGAPRRHRQAWVYVTGKGRSADPAAVAKLDTFRRAFEPYFFEATGGRMSVETGLR